MHCIWSPLMTAHFLYVLAISWGRGDSRYSVLPATYRDRWWPVCTLGSIYHRLSPAQCCCHCSGGHQSWPTWHNTQSLISWGETTTTQYTRCQNITSWNQTWQPVPKHRHATIFTLCAITDPYRTDNMNITWIQPLQTNRPFTGQGKVFSLTAEQTDNAPVLSLSYTCMYL